MRLLRQAVAVFACSRGAVVLGQCWSALHVACGLDWLQWYVPCLVCARSLLGAAWLKSVPAALYGLNVGFAGAL
mgnify:CR=1 FL=1